MKEPIERLTEILGYYPFGVEVTKVVYDLHQKYEKLELALKEISLERTNYMDGKSEPTNGALIAMEALK